MEETDINKNEIQKKSILRPKTSKKVSISEKTGKHINTGLNSNNYIIKTPNIEKNKKNNNLIFSKFDFNNDYLKKEEKSFKIKLKNLNNINLLENKNQIDKLYKWENLFNNMNPAHSYISLKKVNFDGRNINEKKDLNENITDNIKDYKSPILLVDLPEDQMNLFFQRKNSQNYISTPSEKNNNLISENNHSIRPVSMYVPREENSCFYYSNTFSDYYKEDFKSFCEKIPILKAKLKINSEKLKKEIFKQNNEIINKYRIFEEKKKYEDTGLSKQDLIIAGKRKNPMPLIKSVHLQKYKSLYNSDENKDDFSDIKNKGRNSLNLKNDYSGNNFGKSLLLSYYDINDPSLSLFKENINTNDFKTIRNNIFQNYYLNERNIGFHKLDDISSKKDQETQKSNNSKETKKNSFTPKNQIEKTKLKLLNTNSAKKNNIKQMKNIKFAERLNFKPLLNSDNLFQEEYIPPNSFPLKTSSNVGNISYDKIKHFMKERQFLNIFKLKYQAETDSTSPTLVEKSPINKTDLELILNSKKIKPKKNWTLFDSIYGKNKKNKKIFFHYDKNGNLINNDKNKYNVIYFNKCIKTKFDKEMTKLKKNFDNNCFFPFNSYNKGNIHLKKKKNKKESENKKEKEKEKNKIGLLLKNSNINF